MTHRGWPAVVATLLAGALALSCASRKIATGNRGSEESDANQPRGSSARRADQSAVSQDLDVGAQSDGGSAVPSPSASSSLDAERGSFVSLEVPGFPPSLVWVPRGNAVKPLLVATHGAGGRPEAHCERWRDLVADRAFVLCVRGAKINRSEPLSVSRHYYPDHLWLGRAVDANLAAFGERFSEVGDSRDAVYAGYSQGAVMGALMLMSRAHRLPRALLIEGQQNDWNVSGARHWREAGGQRVGLVCGLLNCSQAYEKSRRSLASGGVDVRFEYAPGGGHTYDGRVGERVADVLEWLIADDPRWSPPAR